jgi:hypothetical protein
MNRPTTTVRNLSDPKFTLVTALDEIERVLSDLNLSEYIVGCLFVEVVDGDYGEVWGIWSRIPYLTEVAYKLN